MLARNGSSHAEADVWLAVHSERSEHKCFRNGSLLHKGA